MIKAGLHNNDKKSFTFTLSYRSGKTPQNFTHQAQPETSRCQYFVKILNEGSICLSHQVFGWLFNHAGIPLY